MADIDVKKLLPFLQNYVAEMVEHAGDRQTDHCGDASRHLNITSADAALAVVTRYFDEKQLQPKTRLILESLFN